MNNKILDLKSKMQEDYLNQVAAKWRIILADMIDYLSVALIIYGFIKIISYSDSLETNDSRIYLYIAGAGLGYLYYLSIVFSRGTSLGKYLMDIRFISLPQCVMISRDQYRVYAKLRRFNTFKYSELYYLFYIRKNKYNQNKSMASLKMVLVSRRQMKKIITKYRQYV